MCKNKILNTGKLNFLIRKSKVDDEDQIWKILKPIIRNGETYAINRNLSRRPALNYWMYGKNIYYVLLIALIFILDKSSFFSFVIAIF